MNTLKQFFLIFFTIFSFLLPVHGSTLTNNTIHITVNDVLLETEEAPRIIENNTFIPLRDICEALDIPVIWNADTKTITLDIKDDTYTLKIDETSVISSKNKTIMLSSPPTIINAKAFVPVRFIAESTGATVTWYDDTKTVAITTENISQNNLEKIQLTLGTKTVYTGESVTELKKDFGEPSRIEKSIYNLDWYIYNENYKEFIMIAIENNMVVGYYTNAKDFVLNNEIKYDSVSKQTMDNDNQITVYTDSNNDNKIYAVLVVLSSYQNKEIDNSQEFLDTQARENFDILNTFRVNNGKSVLEWNDLLVESSKKHCIDMAENGYFAHNSLNGDTHKDRILATGIQDTIAWGENIVAGKELAVDTFDLWINSEGHRINMLRDNFTHVGIASIYKEDSVYDYYSGQNFVEKKVEKDDNKGNTITIYV